MIVHAVRLVIMNIQEEGQMITGISLTRTAFLEQLKEALQAVWMMSPQDAFQDALACHSAVTSTTG
jgi:hypothetical protein